MLKVIHIHYVDFRTGTVVAEKCQVCIPKLKRFRIHIVYILYMGKFSVTQQNYTVPKRNIYMGITVDAKLKAIITQTIVQDLRIERNEKEGANKYSKK